MTYQTILIERDARGVARLMLNRVEKHNAMNADMIAELSAAAAELAAANATPDHLAALAANLAETRAVVADTQEVARLDIAFHALVVEAAGNRALLLSRDALGRLFYPAFEAVISGLPAAPQRLLTAHSAIFEGIRAGDAAEARRWMERHIMDFKRGFERMGLDFAAPIALPTGQEKTK